MSLLIKGMDMPIDGKEIHLRIDSHGEVYVYNTYPTMICKAVEVPTPHGRLIDADMAINKLAENKSEAFSKHQVWMMFSKHGAPTVIEKELKK